METQSDTCTNNKLNKSTFGERLEMFSSRFETTIARFFINLILILALIYAATGCAAKDQSSTNQTSVRWMSRTIYLAYPDATDSSRNNYFQKDAIKTAIKEVEIGSMLGQGYFTFVEADESSLDPITAQTASTDLKSFILIWPDSVFNVFVSSNFGSSIPDPNAVTVINAANKRYFYMIFKASCFETSSLCNNISTNGLKAMVGRQFGLLNGLSTVDCSVYPNDTMCATLPSDTQWTSQNSFKFFNSLNNMLENILNTAGFYQ